MAGVIKKGRFTITSLKDGEPPDITAEATPVANRAKTPEESKRNPQSSSRWDYSPLQAVLVDPPQSYAPAVAERAASTTKISRSVQATDFLSSREVQYADKAISTDPEPISYQSRHMRSPSMSESKPRENVLLKRCLETLNSKLTEMFAIHREILVEMIKKERNKDDVMYKIMQSIYDLMRENAELQRRNQHLREL